jgi:hypothetical protein
MSKWASAKGLLSLLFSASSSRSLAASEPSGPAKFLNGNAPVSLFKEADDLLIGKPGLFYSRYSPKLADFFHQFGTAVGWMVL